MWLGSMILKEKVSLHSGFKFRYMTELRYLKEWHLNFTYGSLLPVQRERVGDQQACGRSTGVWEVNRCVWEVNRLVWEVNMFGCV